MSFFESVKNLIFPTGLTCPICNSEIKKGNLLCEKCKNELQFIGDKSCFKCGRALDSFNKLCDLCVNVNKSFDRGFAVFHYESNIKSAIFRMKFDGDKSMAEFFAPFLFEKFEQIPFDFDFLTFVPMTEKAKKKRGFNQSEALAEKLFALSHVPVYYKVKKVKNTKGQKTLNYRKRMENLEGAFEVDGKLDGKNILIIDDILTTSATLDTLSAELKKRGADKVCFLVIAATD